MMKRKWWEGEVDEFASDKNRIIIYAKRNNKTISLTLSRKECEKILKILRGE